MNHYSFANRNSAFAVVSAIFVLAGLYASSLYNYLLFHVIAEGFAIAVACGVFMVAWNARRYITDHYLLLIGIAYLFVGILDFAHTLSYKGMNIFPGYDANAPTQLWIAARYTESLTLLAAPFLLRRRIEPFIYFLVYGLIVTAIVLSVFFWQNFPDCFLEDAGGLTQFKIISEYIICSILVTSGAVAYRMRADFDPGFLKWLLMSILIMVLAELAFTSYASVFGFANLLGHYFKIISFYFMYKAVIETGLTKPYSMLFRDLHRQREWLDVTLTSIGDAVITTDANGRITFLNRVAEELTGWSMAEAHEKPIQDVFRIVNEYSRVVADDPVSKALSSGLIVGLANHTVLLRKDGGEVPIDDSAAPIRDEAGNVFGVVLIFRNITERRKTENALLESETKYRTLFENMTEEVHYWQVVRDKSGRIKTWRLVDVNPPALKTWGRKTVDEIRGKTTDEIFGPGATEHYLPVVQKIITEGIPNSFEDYFPHLDKYFRFTSVPLGDRFITTGADITSIKKTEQELRRLNKTLEQQVAERTELSEARAKKLQALAVELIDAEERERRQFAHLLHDDLQQMLAAAKMQLQSAPNFSNEPSLKYVGQILEQSITKTRRLSHDLSPAVLHYSGLVAGLRWMAGQMNEQFGLSVLLQAEAAPAVENGAIRLFVFRAVQELLFNTIKHARVKQAGVTLTGSDHHIVVSVSDKGHGFDIKEFLKGAKKAGFGLLSITERADYIGGSLKIDTAPGEGSRFTLTVPLDAVDRNEPATQTSSTRQDSQLNRPGVGTSSGGTRILLADDHRVMRQGLIKLMIGQPGIHVLGEAQNGAEALEQARHLGPDLIVMDISMPVMDGIEATRRIKAELPNVRIIGLTMHDDEQLIADMRQAGAEVVLRKTISADEMLKAIYGCR